MKKFTFLLLTAIVACSTISCEKEPLETIEIQDTTDTLSEEWNESDTTINIEW